MAGTQPDHTEVLEVAADMLAEITYDYARADGEDIGLEWEADTQAEKLAWQALAGSGLCHITTNDNAEESLSIRPTKTFLRYIKSLNRRTNNLLRAAP